MGVGSNQSVKYASIKNGKISVYVSKGNYTEHDSLEGFIQRIDLVEEEYNNKKKTKVIATVSDGSTWKLKFDFNSGYGRSFCQQLPNVNKAQPVIFLPKCEEKDGRKSSTLFLKQGTSLKWAFTKANPGNMPEAKEHLINGEKVLDRTAQLDFFKGLINEFNKKEAAQAELNKGTESDDLPF